MSQSLAVGDPVAGPAAAHERTAALEPRRALQLALGALWLLDGMLQFQPSMFGRGFPRMLAGSAQGNPAVVARPITWSAGIIGHHVVALNAVFAVSQLLLGLGIAWRPAVKLALAGSVAWSLAVWWLGEGLGGVLAGAASPVDGAPGAVLLYALLAVLLWPADRAPAAREPADRAPAAPFTAARAVGRRAAQASWLVVWLGLAALALLPASRALGRTIADTTPGEPAWLAWTDAHAASALTRHGPLAAVVLAVVLVIVASGTFLPRRAARAVIVLAVVLAAALWVAQGLGGILTGSATDPDTAPLLALLALAFWPLASSPGET
ncbi:MAG TPA: hypothetical protein VJ418_03945 [Streptosporangiaceae bacterium]|jgi:hypothetical protein|nr:hypothetical protein [Streptosporangiaceae bacterium]